MKRLLLISVLFFMGLVLIQCRSYSQSNRQARQIRKEEKLHQVRLKRLNKLFNLVSKGKIDPSKYRVLKGKEYSLDKGVVVLIIERFDLIYRIVNISGKVETLTKDNILKHMSIQSKRDFVNIFELLNDISSEGITKKETLDLIKLMSDKHVDYEFDFNLFNSLKEGVFQKDKLFEGQFLTLNKNKFIIHYKYSLNETGILTVNSIIIGAPMENKVYGRSRLFELYNPDFEERNNKAEKYYQDIKKAFADIVNNRNGKEYSDMLLREKR